MHDKPTSAAPSRSCVLHVCTSCRPSGTPREPEENRAGFKLYRELEATIQRSHLAKFVKVKPAECLSLCPRPCGIAVSSTAAWTYLFGDQDEGSAHDILDCVSLYLRNPEGVMPREQRPKRLRAGVLGRVPPLPDER